VLQEWTFDQAGDLRGWQPNGHVAEAAVTGGQLTCRTIGADPILELKPLLGLPATPWQFDVADSLACAACSYLR
jgi:hypothetical protein